MSPIRFWSIALAALLSSFFFCDAPKQSVPVTTAPEFTALASVHTGSAAYAVLIKQTNSQAQVWDAYASHSLYDVALPVSGDSVRTIAVDPFSTGFLIATTGGRVHTLNPVSGNLTLIGTITSSVIRSMAVRPSDGRIYLSNSQNNTVVAMSRSGSIAATATAAYAPGAIAYDATTGIVVVTWINSSGEGEARCLGGASLDTKGTYTMGAGLSSVSTTNGKAYVACNSKVPKSEIRVIDLSLVETEEDPTGTFTDFVGPIAVATSNQHVHVYDAGTGFISLFNDWGPAADPVEQKRITCAGKPTDFADGGSPGGGGDDGAWPPPYTDDVKDSLMFCIAESPTSTAVMFDGALSGLYADPEHSTGGGGRYGSMHSIAYGSPSSSPSPTYGTTPAHTTTPAFATDNGDPISMYEGGLTESLPIVTISDVGFPIDLEFQYSSVNKYDGPLGQNWKHTYDDFLKGDSGGHIITVDDFLAHQTYTLETSTGIYKGPSSDSDWITIDPNSITERYVRMSKFGVRRTYNSSGRLTTVVDRNGNTQTLLYRCGKLQYVVGSGARWIGFSYDSSDRIIGVYDFTGRAWAMEYDLARRLVKVTAPPISGATGPSTTFEYAPDVNGTPSPALAKKRDANNAVVYSNTYDAQNRVIAQVWGGHTATLSFATNAGFNETTYTQFDGTVILYKFTAAGELVEERLFTRGVRSNEPTYYARTYVFGTNGLHSQVVHPSGLVEEYEYDARGNVTTSRSRPSLLSTSSIETHATYSSNFNQVLTSTDELGNVTSYTYDTHGNLLRVDYPTVTVPATQAAHVEFTYNSHGQMTQSLDEEGRKTTYAYAQSGPSVGFLVETRHEVSAGVDEVYSVSVDALGRIAAETTPWGATSTRTFNKWDLVTTATSPSGATTTFSYDGNGRPLSIVRPNRRVDGSAAPGAATYTTTFEHEVRGYVTKARSEFASGQYAEVTHTYSPLGYVATTTDPNGKVTRNDYDERGFLWKVRRGYGSSDEISTTQDYDLDGRLVKTVDPRGNATSLTYDEYGRVVKMAGSGQGYVTTSWNARGDVTSSAFYDTMGTASTSDDQVVGLVNFLVDERARIYGVDRRITGNTYAQTRLYLDKSRRLTQSVSPSGQSSTMEYDGAGRLIATRDALQNKAARQIANGRVVSEMAYDRVNGTDVLVAQSTLGYDTEGNLSTVTQLPVGGASGAPSRVSSTSYDVDGRPLVAVDPLGHETRFAYDGLGRLLSRTRPHNTSNLTETYAYDAGGRMVSRTDSAGESVSFAYDHLNRRTSATYPGSKVETFVHDENGNLTRWTDRNGTVVQQAFDSINRLTGRTMTLASGVLGATSESYTYDSVDRLLTASNNAGSGHSTSRTYDWRGALTSETQDSRTMTYGYDLDGARTSRTSPSGRALAYGRDALKRLTSISGTSPTSSTLLTNTWTGAGRKTAGSFGNGVSWTRTYDAYLRPTSEVHSLSGTALFGRTYEYDLANNVKTVGHIPDGVYDIHTVDDLDRVTSSTLRANAPTNPTTALGTLGVTLDGRGNRSETAWTFWGSSTPTTTAYTGGLESSYASVGGVSFTYDANGNLKSDGNRLYAYDWANHLVEVREASGNALIASYEYDALGRRVRKQVFGQNAKTAVYVYDGCNLAEEYDGQGTRVAHYIHGDGVDRPAVIETGTSTFYYHLDRLGSVSAITDASGAVVERYVYGPNGETAIFSAGGTPLAASSVGNPFGYTGQVLDGETGLYHFRARAYSPSIGRFLQLDPAGFVDGMNRYQYAGGNPLAFTDPSGCGFWSALGEICSSAVSAAVEVAVVTAIAIVVTAAVIAAPVSAVVAVTVPLAMNLTAMAAVGAATVEGSRQVAEACGADPQTVKLVGDVTELTLIVVPGTMAAHEAALMREAAFANRARKLGVGGQAPPAPEGATPGGSAQGEPPPHAYRGERAQGTGGATQPFPSKSETTAKVEVTGAAAESPTPAAGAPAKGGTTEPFGPGVNKFPLNRGFELGTVKKVKLQVGSLWDRFGLREGSQFLSPIGTPFEKRGLPSSRSLDPQYTFEVLRQFEVDLGIAVGGEGIGAGGGIQIDVSGCPQGSTIQELVKAGYIRMVIK